MLTYGYRNVTQDNIAVGGGGGSGFVPPAWETNETQMPNKNHDGDNVNEKLLLG